MIDIRTVNFNEHVGSQKGEIVSSLNINNNLTTFSPFTCIYLVINALDRNIYIYISVKYHQLQMYLKISIKKRKDKYQDILYC